MTEEFRNTYKLLFDSYDAKLTQCHAEAFSVLASPIDYIATYLKAMRDCLMLKSQDSQNEDDSRRIMELTLTIAEYAKYKASLYEKELVSETGDEERIEALDIEAKVHTETFWKMVAYSIERWAAAC